MKKIIPAAALLFITAVISCNKNSTNLDNRGLAGKWKLTRIHSTAIINGQTYLRDTMFTDSKYYMQFNIDGSGISNVNEPIKTTTGYTDVNITGSFTYKVSDQNLTCSYANGGLPLVRPLTFNGSNQMSLSLTTQGSAMSLPNSSATIIEYYSR